MKRIVFAMAAVMMLATGCASTESARRDRETSREEAATAELFDDPAMQRALKDGRVQIRNDGDLVQLVVPTGVLFAPQKSTLTATQEASLRRVCSTLRNLTGPIYVVEGYADTVTIKGHKYSSNLELAAVRAHAVANILVEEGVPEGRIRLYSYGNGTPSKVGTSGASAADRRAEIVLVNPREQIRSGWRASSEAPEGVTPRVAQSTETETLGSEWTTVTPTEQVVGTKVEKVATIASSGDGDWVDVDSSASAVTSSAKKEATRATTTVKATTAALSSEATDWVEVQ